MSHSYHHFSLKPHSLREFLPGFFSLSLQSKEGDIDDDWECIEVLDQEVADAREQENSGDPEDSDHFPYPFPDVASHHKIKYSILCKADVRRRLDDKITRVSTVLPLSRAEAALLLHYFKWSVSRTTDEWLAREDEAREAVGLFKKPCVETPDAMEIACRLCHENFPEDLLLAVSCGHQFCHSCWTGFISKAISDGPRCLTLRCADPSCDAAVGLDMIEQLSSEEDMKKFENYLLRSYVNCSKKAKWCPAPGCDYAVFYSSTGDFGDANNITCHCLHSFCWNCISEAHAPVDCDTVPKWMSEISTQSENWLLANTKPCPKCENLVPQPGYNHTICNHCNHEFCCICGGDWYDHGDGQEWWSCNCLDYSLRPAGYHVDDELEREIAKNSLKIFNHYYEEWASNESSRANAVSDLKLFQNLLLEMLGGVWSLSVNELDFIVQARLQIIECWQLLKWTHVHGYFLPEEEHNKQNLHEFMQEQAKELVGRLEKQVEELQDFLYGDLTSRPFIDFREKLVMLTRVTRKYFDRMADALNTGLSEVVTAPRPTPRPTPRMNMSREGRSSGTSPSASSSTSTRTRARTRTRTRTRSPVGSIKFDEWEMQQIGQLKINDDLDTGSSSAQLASSGLSPRSGVRHRSRVSDGYTGHISKSSSNFFA